MKVNDFFVNFGQEFEREAICVLPMENPQRSYLCFASSLTVGTTPNELDAR